MLTKRAYIIGLCLVFASTSTTQAAIVLSQTLSTGRVDNFGDADALLAGSNVASTTTLMTPFIDYVDPETSSGGFFAQDSPFPLNTPGNDDHFAIRASGFLQIDNPGRYTFGVHSDDGTRLRIDAGSGFQTLFEGSNNGFLFQSYGQIEFMQPGNYEFDLVYFEQEGGALLEWYAAQGDFNAFDASMQLVGDTTNGGIGVSSVPEPASGTLLTLVALLGCTVRRRHV